MWISDTSIRRPVFATMAIMSFMVLGAVSMSRLGIDLYPSISIPFVMVNTIYPGAAPEEVETLVSRPIEDVVSSINGVKRVESHSTESVSRVAIEFELEVDPQQASSEVREKVAAIRYRLPAAIEDPTIMRFDVASLPILTYAVGSSLPADVSRRIVEDDLKPLIEQVAGVAAVEVNGGLVREIHVDLDPGRLEALQVPLTVAAEALAADNLDVPGGKITRGGRDVSLRTEGEFQSLDEIGGVILRSAGGSTVRLRDVATVRDGFEDRTSTTRLNGADAVSFSIQKQSGANTVAVADGVHEALARVAPQFPQIRISPVHDDSEFIRENVADVRFNIIFGGVMAVLIIFIFMRDWRSTVISALALPTSVIATFFFMWVVGFTINMMTLMALSLVIGILIDDAVVVRENIYRHMERGEDAMTAASRGTSEIGLAVMATTFTILAVFLPVGFMTGIVGQFFTSFALTVSFAVAMSLFVAFTLDPMLSSRFVRYIPPEERMGTWWGRMLEAWGRGYDRLDRLYHRLLEWAIDRPWRVLVAAAAIFVASLATLPFIGTEFVPVEDRGEFNVMVDLPPGTSFDESVATVAEVERELLAVPEVRQVFSTVGIQGEIRRSTLRVRTTKKNDRERGILAIKDDVRSKLRAMPFVDAKVADPEMMQGVPYEPPIIVNIRGTDMPTLQRVSDELLARVKQVPGAVDVSSSLVSGQPEMVARIDRARASDMGFSVAAVAMQLRGMVEGVVPSKLREGDKQYDIRLRLAPEFRNDFDIIARAPLYSPRGTLVRVGDIVTMAPGVGPTNIEREQRRRQASIGVDLSGRSLGQVTADVDAILASMDLPPSIDVSYAGDVELMQDTASALVLALTLAVAFIYIVLASQFDSFVEPFIIMLSLPLAIVGALLLLLMTGQHLGMPAMIGVVMLMGLVTKNAILLVDYTNQARREGATLEEAILTAGPVRLRPILMTTAAMILGMLPAAIGRGEGAEFRSPMALAIIGGLVTSTALTLLVVPVVYLLLARLAAWATGARRRGSAAMAGAVRVGGILLLLALVGAFLAVTRAFAQTGPDAAPTAGPLTYERALDLAFARNQSLKTSAERVLEAQARVREAAAGFLPAVDLAYLYTPVQDFPTIRIPAGIFGPDEQTFKAAFTRSNIFRLEVTQPLYAGGRIRGARDIATSQLAGEQLGLERARQELTLRVVETFYAVVTAERAASVAEQGLTLAENQLALARTRFEAGSAARLDVLRSEVEVASAQGTLVRARAATTIAKQGLRTVLSLPYDAAVEVRGTLEDTPPAPPLDGLLAAVRNRPDVRALATRRDAALEAAALARGEMKPSAALVGNLQYQEDRLGGLFKSENRSYQAGLAISLPVTAAPGARAREAAASAQARQVEHGLETLVEFGTLELVSAYTEWQAAGELVATQTKAVELARESMAIAEVSYENGVITSVDLSAARLALLNAELGLLQARYAQIVAQARTTLAAGR